MQSSNYPTPIPLPFAENAGAGYKTTVPQASQIGVTPGAASYNDGFPPLTMTAKTAGGIPPRGQDINGVLNAITRAVRWSGAGGHYPYNSTFSSDSNVLGYPVGAKVLSADGTAYWVNQTENNTTNPDSGGAGWYPSESFAFASVTLTNSNVTLTPAQYNKEVIILSGAMTTNLNLIFPAISNRWTVVNKCTGAYNVTCKTASGSGVAIYSGNAGGSQDIYCDRANILYFMGNQSLPMLVGNATTPQHAVALGQFSGVLSVNGYMKIPLMVGGVLKTGILQWLAGQTNSSGRLYGTWPIPFPNALLAEIPTCAGAGATGISNATAATSGSGANASFYDVWADTAINGAGVTVFGIGY